MAVYFDVTSTVSCLSRNPEGTGVQRVTTRIVDGAKQHGWRGCAAIGDSVYDLDDLSLDGLRIAGRQTISERIHRYRSRPLKMAFHWAKLNALQAAGRVGARGILRMAPERRHISAFRPDDTVVIMDSNETVNGQFIDMVLAGRPKLCVLVHDTIPITHPETCRGERGKAHSLRQIELYSQLNPLWICVSKSTEKQFRDIHENMLGLGEPRTYVVPLAHEFIPNGNAACGSGEDMPDRFVLFVGHRGQRKGMATLAKAWDAVQGKGYRDVHLVLAGNGQSSHMPSGSNVRYIDFPSDQRIADLYHRCLFTVYPSEFEGWGLPVGESLWFGKRVIAARNSSITEAGGDWATYFETGNSEDLAERMMNFIDSKGLYFPDDIRPKLRTWNMVAEDMRCAISC